MDFKRVAIVGGGPIGSTLAIQMAKRGLDVTLIDKRQNPLSKEYVEEGRSINYILSNRGIKCWEDIGIMDEISSCSKRYMGNTFHSCDGTEHDYPFVDKEARGYFVKRTHAQQVLARKIQEYPNIKSFYNTSVTNVNLDKTSFQIIPDYDEKTSSKEFDFIFAADGVHSVVRNAFNQTPDFNFEIRYFDEGYVELLVSSQADGTPRLRDERSHLWLSSKAKVVMLGLQNMDNTFSGPLVLPRTGEFSFDSLDTPSKFEEHLKNNFQDAKDHMNLLQQCRQRKVGNFITVKCSPWYKEKFLLIGDSCHAMSPVSAQALNVGLESLSVFDKKVKENNGDLVLASRQFYKEYKPNADAITNFSTELHEQELKLDINDHFVFILNTFYYLECQYPDLFKSQQTLSQRTLVPFSQVYSFAKVEQAILGEVLYTIPDIKLLVQNKQFDLRVQDILKKYQGMYALPPDNSKQNEFFQMLTQRMTYKPQSHQQTPAIMHLSRNAKFSTMVRRTMMMSKARNILRFMK